MHISLSASPTHTATNTSLLPHRKTVAFSAANVKSSVMEAVALDLPTPIRRPFLVAMVEEAMTQPSSQLALAAAHAFWTKTSMTHH